MNTLNIPEWAPGTGRDKIPIDFFRLDLHLINYLVKKGFEAHGAQYPIKSHKYDEATIAFVLVFAWISGMSIHSASEKLNKWMIESKKHIPKEFSDNRKSRLIPHQTTINRYLEEYGLPLAHVLQDFIFENMLKYCLETSIIPTKVELTYDMTYRAYYGKRRDAFIKGTTLLKGTNKMRHYHGAMIHFGSTSLFVSVKHIRRGDSLVPFMEHTILWLESLGFEIDVILCDREYYKTEVVQLAVNLKQDLIMPAKKYAPVKRAIKSYVDGEKGRVQKFVIQGQYQAGIGRSSAKCWLVINAKRGNNLNTLKNKYRNNVMTIDEIYSGVFVYLTTINPNTGGTNYPYKIKAFYENRWCIETGFRDFMVHRCPWRSDLDGTRLINEMGNMLYYNFWQLFRLVA